MWDRTSAGNQGAGPQGPAWSHCVVPGGRAPGAFMVTLCGAGGPGPRGLHGHTVWCCPRPCGHCQATSSLACSVHLTDSRLTTRSVTGHDGLRWWLRGNNDPTQCAKGWKEENVSSGHLDISTDCSSPSSDFYLVPETVRLGSKVCVGSYESQWSWTPVLLWCFWQILVC